MTGALTISGKDLTAKNVNSTADLKASGKVCVGANCRDFNLKSCNKDSVTIGINTDGSPICLAIKCPSGQYLEQLDPSSGSPICKPIPTGTCPANTYVSEVKTNGTVTCSPLPPGLNQTCPTGKYVTGIASNGTITCTALPTSGKSCSGTTQFVKSYDTNGEPVCGTTANLKIRTTGCYTNGTGFGSGSDNKWHIANCGSYMIQSIKYWGGGGMEYLDSWTCCKLELYYEPDDPSMPLPTMIDTWSGTLSTGYGSGSDNQGQSASCGNSEFEKVSIYSAGAFEYFGQYNCTSHSLSGDTQGKSLYRTCRTIDTGYTSGTDNTWQIASCSSNEFLAGISFYSAGGMEYLDWYTCCSYELR